MANENFTISQDVSITINTTNATSGKEE